MAILRELNAPVSTDHLVHRYGGSQSGGSDLHRQHGEGLSRGGAHHRSHGSNVHDVRRPRSNGWGEARASPHPKSHDDNSHRGHGALGSDAPQTRSGDPRGGSSQ